ncbi:MAG: hypothetical protein MUC36_24330 [Planctomycetes bacterium]|jgi:hypothetical protein|nr:hypothetical protein [Planctomycetota bacterium]
MLGNLRPAGIVLLLTAALAAQTTHIVTGGGAALQNAVQTAAPGDILDVQPGLYGAVVCTKGLRFELQPTAEITAPGLTGNALTLQGLPANEVAIVTGGLVRGIACLQCAGTVIFDQTAVVGTPGSFAPMRISGCTGPVVFGATTFTATAGTNADGELHLINSAQVSCRDCWLPHVRIDNSQASFAASTISPIGVHTAGLHLVSGSALVQGGEILGAFPFSFPIPTAGVLMNGGTLEVTGSTQIQRRPWAPATQASIEGTGGALRLDPSVVVLGSPAIVGPMPVLSTPMPGLAVATAATTLQATLTGSAGDALVTFAGTATAPYATPWGQAWLLPSDPVLDITILPASGTASFSQTFAAVPPFFVLSLQSVAIDPSGGLTIGAPVRFAWN